jgi:anti-sigma factor (TIGR02949 family)
MNCSDLDQFLHPFLDGEFGPDERLDIERHLAECPECSQRVRQEAAFHDAFRQKVRAAAHDAVTAAPEALRLRVLTGIRREQHRAARQGWMKLSAAALLVATAAGAYFYARPHPRQRFVEDAARRHAQGLPYEVRDPEQVEAWFRGKLTHPVRLPRLPSVRLAGARISNVTDRQAAYISYEAAHGKLAGLFVFDDSDDDLGAEPLPSIAVSQSHGYNVAYWREGEIVYELVTDLNEADIRRMLMQNAQGMPDSTPSHFGVQPALLRQ